MAFFCLVRTLAAYMITTTRIKEEFDLILLGLQKRGLDLHSELEDILAQDDIRKRTKKELDDTLHEARILSKEIGGLFKAGKKEEAEQAKSRTSALKAQEKVLHQKLAETEEALTEKLRHIPNVPHESVPRARGTRTTWRPNAGGKQKDRARNISPIGSWPKPTD